MHFTENTRQALPAIYGIAFRGDPYLELLGKTVTRDRTRGHLQGQTFAIDYDTMFVAVACEFANEDHRKAGYDLLVQYGFRKVLKDAFESATLSEMALSRLKKDLDRVADSYDGIRLYQYPVDGTLAITILKEKKWRRLIVKA